MSRSAARPTLRLLSQAVWSKRLPGPGHSLLTLALSVTLLSTVLASCNDEGTGTTVSTFCELNECDVFFTEVMAATAGADAPGEYVELCNTGLSNVDLRYCMLELEKEGGSKPKRETFQESLEVPAGGCITLGPPLKDEEQEAVALPLDYRW